VGGLHATEIDELVPPPRPPVPPPRVLPAYAISSLFRTGAAANVATTARVSPTPITSCYFDSLPISRFRCI
jgi:hypothetical protein